MFELMHRYRVAVLIILFVGLFGWGAWAAIQQLFTRGPADTVLAVYRIPGDSEERKIMESEVQMVRMMIRNQHGDLRLTQNLLSLAPDDADETIMAFIMLREAAKKAGITVADADVIDVKDPRQARIPSETVDFLKDMRAAMLFRFLYAVDPGGPTYEEVYNLYKTMNDEVKGKAVVFERKDPKSWTIDKNNADDVKKLGEWWDKPEFAYLREQKKVPEKFDLEVAWVKWNGRTLGELDAWFKESGLAEATKDLEVTDADCLQRYNALADQYEGFIEKELAAQAKAQEEENARAKAENRDPKNLSAGDQPSKFERVKEQLRRELKVGKLLTSILDDVKGGKRLAELCEAKKISVTQLSKQSADEVMVHPEFGGPRVKQLLMVASQKLKEGKLKEGEIVEYETTSTEYVPRVFDEPANWMALYRVIGRYEPRNPELNEVIDFAIEEYQKKQAETELNDRTKAFRDAIDKKLDAVPEVVKVKETADKELEEAIAKAIADAKLSADNPDHKTQIEAIRKQNEVARDAKINDEKAKHELAALLETAKEQNLAVVEIPWTRRSSSSGMSYASADTKEEKLNRFLRSASVIYGLANLPAEGKVGQPTADHQAGLSAVLALEGKRAPAEDDLLLKPDQMKTVGQRLQTRVDPGEWSYKNFREKAWFDLWAWRIEENLTRRQEADEVRKAREDELNRRKVDDAFKKRRAEMIEKRKADASKPSDAAPPAPPAPPGGGD